MNLHQFRFVQEAVRRNLNLTETAKALFTSQPGISKAILELEEERGIDIFGGNSLGVADSWNQVRIGGALGHMVPEVAPGAMAIGTGIMSGKWGAGEAYWATSVAAAIIMTGFALGRLTQWASGKPSGWHTAIRLALPLLLLVQATRMIHDLRMLQTPPPGPQRAQPSRLRIRAG